MRISSFVANRRLGTILNPTRTPSLAWHMALFDDGRKVKKVVQRVRFKTKKEKRIVPMPLVNGSSAQIGVITAVHFLSVLGATLYQSLRPGTGVRSPSFTYSALFLCVATTLLIFLLLYFVPGTNGTEMVAAASIPASGTGSSTRTGTGTGTGVTV
jgi:hypothetical protein